jgi:hypothetical protein
MHLPSLKYLSTATLATLIYFSGSPLVAQEAVAATAQEAAVATDLVASSPTTPIASPAPLSTDPVSSSSIDQNPPAAQTDVQAPQPQTDEHTDKQTTRILGILPNFRSVSANSTLPPQTVKEKFVTASEDSFDYSALFVPLALAGYDLESNPDPEFGTGGIAYARYLWHAVVDQTSENFFVEAIVPSITHEDNRYYTLGHGGFIKRTGYALSRSVITRSDSGKEVFNISEVVGSGASAGLSSVYYPTRERSFGNTGSQWGLDIGIDALSFELKEFWPDINHYLFHGKKPFKDANPAH